MAVPVQELPTDDLAGTVLRFHPRCLAKQENGNTEFILAMLAAFRSIENNKIVAAHRNEP